MRIRHSLTEDTVLDFFDMPLSDAIVEISRNHSIQLVLDRRTLTEEGIDPSTPVTGSYRGISLRSALTLLLRELDLTYVIANEVMLITAPVEAERRMETRVYPIPKTWRLTPDDLINAMTGTVAVDSWEDVGGPGNVEALGNSNLVIMHTSKVHEEIHDLLRQIDAAAEMERQ